MMMMAAQSIAGRLPKWLEISPLASPASAFPTWTMEVFSAVVTTLRWK